MALTPQEQAELDKLELEQLEAEYAASQKAPAAPATEPAKARRMVNPRTGLPDLRDPANIPGNFDATMQYVLPAVAMAGGPGLSALTASAGNSAVQIRKQLMGEQEGFKAGDAVVAPTLSLASPIPGSGILKTGANAAINGIGAYLAEKVRSKLDDPAGAPDNATKTAAVMAGITALSPILGRIAGKITGNVAPEELARVRAAMDANVGRDAAIEAGQRVGMKPIPSMVNRGNRVVDLLESLGGSGATKKAFAEANDAAAAQAALKHANVPPGMPLVNEALDAAEGPAIQKYSRVESIGNQGRADLQALKDKIGLASDPHQQAMALEANAPQLEKLNAIAGADLAAWKDARKEVGRLYSAPYHSQDPKAIDAAEALADSLEAKIVKAGEAIGDPELLKQIEQGRREFAKVNDVRRVMNQPGGSINTRKVGTAYQKDPEKMTGELADVGAFANQFKEAVGDGRVSMDPGNSGTNVAGAGAMLLKGQPLAAAATLLNPRQAARSALMSDFIQQRFARPNYTPSTSADPVITAIIQRIMLQEEAARNRQ